MYVGDGGVWPEGPFEVGAAPVVGWAAEFVGRVALVLAGKDPSEVAAAAGLASDRLWAVLKGEAWPDLEVVGVLEQLLGVELLPRWGPGSQS